MIPAASIVMLPNTQARHGAPSTGTNAASMILSLLKKPENGGTPMMASQPAMNVSHVIVMYRASPPKRRMFTWSSMPCMTEPAPRNMPALKKPCVIRWKIANAYPTGPSPAARIM